MNGCYWLPRKGTPIPKGNLGGLIGNEGGDYDGSCLYSHEANGELDSAASTGLLGAENIKFSTTIHQMFKNGLQCKDEKKFCKSSGQEFVDHTHNRTTYEWNTEILND